MKHYTDRDIVEALLTREERKVNEATRQLYHQHHKMITHFVNTSGGTTEDAEDLFQELLIAFLDNLWAGNYQLRMGVKLSTYLFEVAKNLWYKKIRSRTSGTIREINYMKDYEAVTPDAPDALQQMIVVDEERWSLTIFQRLNAEAQSLLRLVYLDKLSLKEIGVKLGKTEDAVKMYKHRIMRDLSEKMKNRKDNNA
jgi:RNA polymerase sigma factor (sigma-70 family)